MPTDPAFTSNFTISQRVDDFGQPVSYNPDFQRLPYCECGESFLQYVREHFSQVLAYPTIRTLDQAILSLTIEYAERRRQLKHHPLHSCVPVVFHEVLDTLTAKRFELLRHPTGSQAAHVYVGQDETTKTED